MANLVKLRHFLVPSDEFHSNICNVGKVLNLQELQRFKVRKGKSGFELSELGKLEEIGGSLDICNLENALVNEAHESKLLYKNRLQKLTLRWKNSRSGKNPESEDQVLESLRPHSSLHKLFIDGHGGSTCPTWLGKNLSTKDLEALRLDKTDWDFLPPLGELYQIGESREEYFGCITGPNFRNLKRLELVQLPRFSRWVANEVCPSYFSLIEVLIVKFCPELTELPFSSYTSCYPPKTDSNVTWFPRLREIEIVCCKKLLSLPPFPYSHTLYSAELSSVGRGLETLHYLGKSNYLRIKGDADLHSLDETVLVFRNLTQLQELSINTCPPLAEKHLKMLTSLKSLKIDGSSITFLPLARSDKWQLPVNSLQIKGFRSSGKQLTRLLTHLPRISELLIEEYDKITRLGVDAKQHQTAAPLSLSLPASSAVKLQETHRTDQQEETTQEVEEVVAGQEDDDGLLLLPAHLSDSLQKLDINGCSELILIAESRGNGGGGLQAMRSLKKIELRFCPKFLSASDLSSCCPFPSSLRDLDLCYGMKDMDTLAPLSNLTSLENLRIRGLGHLRCEGLLPLLTQGQLNTLEVCKTPKFFAGWDPAREMQGEQEQQLLSPSSKLQELKTDDVAGVFAAPICRLLSSSLTKLTFKRNAEVKSFTKEQEKALSLLTSLQELNFNWCDELRHLPAGLNKLTNLKSLQILDCPAIMSLPKNGLPSSLQGLDVRKCTKLRRLPAGLHKLTNLKSLLIQECPAIRSLPKNGLPSSLQELDVEDCNNAELTQQCRSLMGTIPELQL